MKKQEALEFTEDIISTLKVLLHIPLTLNYTPGVE